MTVSNDSTLPYAITRQVRDTCLCLHLQRAARAIARRFDEALRPTGLGNGQFSLLMALNRPVPPTIGDVAQLLAMDRTTLTAALKPLARRGLVEVGVDEADRRSRRLVLTASGRDLLSAAVPLWRAAHAVVGRRLGVAEGDRLRAELRGLSAAPAIPRRPRLRSRANGARGGATADRAADR
jgi:DNA-binding MarR family transcriptional regulator